MATTAKTEKGVNPDLINQVVQAKNADVNVRAFPDTAAKTSNGLSNTLFTAKKGEPVGRTSGDYYKINGYYWLVVNLYNHVKFGTGTRSYGYVRSDVVDLFTPKVNTNGEQNAQAMMNDLVLNDKKLYYSLLKIGYLVDKAKKQKKNTSKIEAEITKLKKAYEARQAKIKANKSLTVKAWADDTLKKIKSFFGIGELATLTVVAIGAVIVGVAVAATIYYTFKPDYETGKENLTTSKELEKALASLTPEEAQKVKNDLENQIDTAYNQGKTDQSFASLGGGLKTILLIGAGAFAVMQLSKNK